MTEKREVTTIIQQTQRQGSKSVISLIIMIVGATMAYFGSGHVVPAIGISLFILGAIFGTRFHSFSHEHTWTTTSSR